MQKQGSNHLFKNLIYTIITISILLYVSYQIYHMTMSPIILETAVNETVFDSITANAFAIRDEELLQESSDGVLVQAVPDGERITAGNPALYLFTNEFEAQNYVKNISIDKQLKYYKKLQSHKNIYTVDPNLVDKSIENILNDIQRIKNLGKLDEVAASKQDLLNNLNQRQLITNTLTDEMLSSKIKELSELQTEIPDSNYTKILAPVAGTFVNHIDGYENTIPYENISNLTVADFEKCFSKEPQNKNHAVGKLIKEFDWYIVCSLDTLSISDFKIGQKVTIDFPLSSVEPITTTIYKIKNDSNGKALMILKSNLMNKSLLNLRKGKIQIRKNVYKGLHIPSKAIRINSEGEKGVFVKTGNIIEFKKIEEIYESSNYILSDIKNEKGYIKLYDEIVVSGKNLYDGKVIR